MDVREFQQFQLAEHACKLYYHQGLTQKAIGSQLGMRDASVSRIIKQAHQLGWVRISIHPPNDVELSRRLLTGLKSRHSLHDGDRFVLTQGGYRVADKLWQGAA